MAMSALKVSTDTQKSPLTLDDSAALECAAEMILGRLVLNLYPHITKSSYQDALLELELTTPRRLTGAETIACRLAMENAATAILTGYVTSDPSGDDEADSIMHSLLKILAQPPAGGRHPFMF